MFVKFEGTRSRLRLIIGPILLIMVILFGSVSPSWAQNKSSSLKVKGQRVEEIRLVGNRRIPESTILYYIQSRENDPYNESQLLRDYRSLLNTNFFEDVTLKVTQGEVGIIVIYEIRERPLVRSIEYEGMKSFKESDVLERFRDLRVGLTVDSPFDASKLPKARRALRILLDENGRPLGRIEVETEQITSSSLILIFRIDEGPKVRIGKLSFDGNTILSDKQLQESLELTKERAVVSIFKGYDKYIKEKMEYDLQVNMLEDYRSLGYIYAKAGEPVVDIVEARRGWLLGLRKTKQQYHITIPIEEGEQYTYGSFKVEGVTNLDVERVERFYNVHEGDIVNYTALKEANDTLKKAYSRSGYLDVTVMPQISPNRKERLVNLTVRVDEGKQYIVHRIRFSGNTKTRDKVLRREFFLEEQDRFNGDLLDVSVLRINQLGFFDKIEEKDYEVVKRPNLSEVDVVVKVKEKSQQSIGVTGGHSGIYGAFFGINYASNNFRGMGQRIDVRVTTGSRYSNYMFGYSEPYFLDTKWNLGLRIFNTRYRFDTYTAFFGLISPSQNKALFSRITTGMTLFTTHPIGRWTRLGLEYSLQNIKIDDVDPLFANFAVNQMIGFTPGGSREDAMKGIIRSEITPRIIYNTKNQYYGATAGSHLILEAPIAGSFLGGSFNVIKPFIEYQKFMPDKLLSGGRHTFAFRVRLMHMVTFGRLPNGSPMAVPFFERVFLGSEFNLRGFAIRSVTPWALTKTPSLDNDGNPLIDPATGLPAIKESIMPVGGDTSAIFTAEYRVPIVGPFQVVPFIDVGTSTVLKKDSLRLFGPNTYIELLKNTNNVIRISTGAELQFLMPMVNQPFRLIFAYNPKFLDTSVVLEGVRLPLQERKRDLSFSVGHTF